MGAVLTNISNFKAFAALTVVKFRENSLTTTSVNNILIDLDDNGLLNGECRLTGGSSSAPTGDGLIAQDNLLSKGWVANTN